MLFLTSLLLGGVCKADPNAAKKPPKQLRLTRFPQRRDPPKDNRPGDIGEPFDDDGDGFSDFGG